MAFSLLAGCTTVPSTPASPFGSQENQIHGVKPNSRCPCLYVANAVGNSVTVYPVGRTGDRAPSWYIAGSDTRLDEPDGIAVDSSGNIYVASSTSNSINVYAAGARGNVAPTAVISGAHTGLSEPWGVAIDPVNSDIYVANLDGAPSGHGSITFYATGSNGNVAPTSSIAGSHTDLYEPEQVAFDSNLNIYVVDYGHSSVTVYPAGANGNIPPSKGFITGKKTKLDLPESIALDASGKIYVSNSPHSTITVYAAGSSGNVKPYGTLKGTKTMLNYPSGIAIR